MASFQDILDRQSSEIERPKPLPTGTYECVVKGLPRFDKSSKKQTDFVEFTLQPTGTLDDVDQEALDEMGGFASRTIKATFYLTEDAAWRLKKFLVDLGIDESQTLRQMIDEAPGSSVLATIKHRASEDGQSIFGEIGGTAKVGE
ncbi:MAG TPA: hypothetical protein VGA05_08555 [Candidatus Bathyarchaeia archaeon]